MAALIIMHMQNDYLDGGPIGIPNSLNLVPIINRLKQQFSLNIFIKDCHPFDHSSFKNHGGDLPKHCVKNTKGVELNSGIDICDTDYVIHKGLLTLYDSSSAFYDAQIIKRETKLNTLLENNNIKSVYLCGVSLDNEIFSTALDCSRFKYDTYVILDAVCGSDENKNNKVLNFMKSLGTKIVMSQDLI